MKVYVLRTGEHDEGRVSGVFSDIAKAKAAWQPTRRAGEAEDVHKYEWVLFNGAWEFDASWNNHAYVEEFEIDAVHSMS
jgi:hypothetical protein